MQKILRTRILPLLILIFLFQIPSYSASKKYFVITGKIVLESGDPGAGSVEIIKTGKGTTTIDIPKTGKFKLELEFFNEFTLIFKSPGHFNKTIIVSTEIPQDVWERDNEFPAFPIVVQLLKEFEGIDKSFTLKPTGKIYYGKAIDNFEKESYISDIQFVEQVETAKQKAIQVQKESQTISKEDAQDLAVKQKKFDQLIKEADGYYQRGEFQMAYMKYLEAKNLFPDKSYPNDRVAELQDLVKALELTEKQKANLDLKYQEAIAKANDLFDAKKYQDALPDYNEALQYRPGDVFANGRIKEIEQLLAQLEFKKKYNEIIASADKKYGAKDLTLALDFYTKALTAIPNDSYALSQIKQINEEIQQKSKQAQIETEFNQNILAADAFLKQKDYQNATDLYKKALALKPDNSQVKDKLAQIADALAKQEAEVKTRNEFKQVLADAESSYKNKDLEKAKELYTKANQLIPSESIPPKRLDEINGLLAEKAKKEADLAARLASYLDAVKRADQSFAGKEYESAQAIYKEALQIKPDEKYPSDQIALILNLMKEQKDLQFNTAIAKADAAFNAGQYDDAGASYKEALQYQNSSYANKQLTEIERKKAEIKVETLRQKKIQDQYDQILASADDSFKNKEYQKSKDKYTKALTIKPDEVYPKEQISKLDQLLGEIQKGEELNRQYTQLLKDAQLSYGKSNLKEARDAYQKANQLKPAEPVPSARIAEIDKMIAQKEEAARIAALESEKKQAAEKAIQDKYNAAIDAGDKAYVDKKHAFARVQYASALEAMPNEKYPKDQIAKIDDYLAKEERDKIIALQKIQQDSLLKTSERLFNRAMASAKEQELTKRYQQANQSYEEAIRLNPQKKNEIQKLINANEDKIQLLIKQTAEYKRIIKRADDLFAASRLTEALDEYQNAVTIKTDEDYPKKQIKEIQARFVVLDASYTLAIKAGDDAYKVLDWVNAKKAYTEALALKIGEPYPTNRLKEVERNLAQINLENANKQAAQKAYDDAIAKAEKSFKDDQLSAARMQYEEAKSLQPEAKLPEDRIKEIDSLIEQRKKDQLAKTQQDVDDKYRQAISLADNSFREKSYAIAKLKYKQALLIKPDESYPQNQMDLIDKMLSVPAPVETYTNKIPAEEKTVQPAATAIVYNPEESAQATEARANSFVTITDYDEALKKADASFGIKDYSVARFFYTKANEIRPKEEYPIKQLELIRKLIDSGLSAADLAAYEAAISKADASFSKEDYGIAKFFYYKALEIKSWEKYPKERIDEILARTNSLLSEKEEKIYRDIINKGDEAYFNKDIAVARFYYNKAISMKRDEEYPLIKLKDIKKLVIQDKQDQRNIEYRNYLELADQAFKNGNYSIARFNYNKALSVKPEEKYPLDQLKRIKQALDK